MEKIVLSSNKELEIYGISNTGNVLALQFQNGNIAELEKTFSDQRDLKRITLTNADGQATSVFKNYSIFRTISKQKDVVTVSLEQKPEWMVAQENMRESYDAAILDLGKAVGNANMESTKKEGEA